ncbi:glycosyltransferase family 4 protein [Aeromicrobium sp.]|uniref:glycosyltransferase family 4 protein n=1 Tax=Aeromicrobium sp. TaxID=1871063 RepID=UPI0030BC95C7
MKVVMLATGLTGYLDASFRQLVDHGVELFIITRRFRPDVDYQPFPITQLARVHAWEDEPTGAELNRLVDDFDPDAVLVHSWHVPPYRAVLKKRAGLSTRLLWMDNNWLGTPKQWLGRATSPWYVRRLFDAAFVPCERTELFARRLGFGEEDILRGSLAADTDLYGAAPVAGAELLERAQFVSALRMVHHKGADVLAEAYDRYRSLADDPWNLHVAGEGPLLTGLVKQPGVVSHGFVQPAELSALMHRSSAYINPSRAEPYGVVLHEAAASSLPILTSSSVGAAPTMVQDGYNGWMVPPGDPDALAAAMVRLSGSTPDRLGDMSRVSHAMSQRLSPQGWARNMFEFLAART